MLMFGSLTPTKFSSRCTVRGSVGLICTSITITSTSRCVRRLSSVTNSAVRLSSVARKLAAS
ncbi:hypothetical protein GBAR_LOCUS14517 [Geodia barretti]|uniref:Uncharacterized protein n=1 Tax=Geodia barretti TaxID=519541 RepID=A0AA35WLS0_GEOBA|nr:hypothetical protein GBAR_LOCUS14517 [Geodia barretti]